MTQLLPDTAPLVLWLHDERACRADAVGGKAAALARARAAGLPVVPGFVLSTAATVEIDAGRELGADVRAAWEQLGGDGVDLVVRSSSTVEDRADSSMAGQFESVVGVRGWSHFVSAVGEVLDSRARAADADPLVDAHDPIAVLVQPLLDADCGGVLFGVDPVTGRSDRRVVTLVSGGPDRLVSGEVEGSRYVLTPQGGVVEHDDGAGGAQLTRRQRGALVDLVDRAGEVFDGAQDVEWAYDRQGELWLLQSRPVTTPVAGVPSGPVFGPGPVAETFPDPLSALEQDLWIEPLRTALREALALTGTVARRRLADSPVVICVDGRAAVDLDLVGQGERPSAWARLDPRPGARRLRAAWAVGRLRGALQGLAEDVLHRADDELAAVPALEGLTDRQLVALLGRTRQALTSVHAHEVLVGLLADPEQTRLTGTSLALRALVNGRAAGLDDEQIVGQHPVVLALSAPRVGPREPLPPVDEAPPWSPGEQGDRLAVLREALRLRARWLQELTARAAWELGRRLHERGALQQPEAVRHLPLEGLEGLVRGRAAAWHPERGEDLPAPGPLPARFQLTDLGRPVAVTGGSQQQGTGAGGGRGTGVVHSGDGPPPGGAVLVVSTLDPALAPALSNLSGLVAETGSVLSHLAILARESGVPTVVGVPDAVARFPAGTVLTVDGTSGEVVVEEEDR